MTRSARARMHFGHSLLGKLLIIYWLAIAKASMQYF